MELTTAQSLLEAIYAEELDLEDLEAESDTGIVETADGCSVEPDGICPHGYRSPLLVLGII